MSNHFKLFPTGDFRFKQDPSGNPSRQLVTPTPDIFVHQITDQDEFIVLACDGVWDVMTNQEVCDLVHEGNKSS